MPTQTRPGAFPKLAQTALVGKQIARQAEFRSHDDGWRSQRSGRMGGGRRACEMEKGCRESISVML